MKKFFLNPSLPLITGMFGLIFLLITFFCFFRVSSFSSTPLRPSIDADTDLVVFSITPGQGLETIATNLEEGKLISNATLFKIYSLYKGFGFKLKAGEYRLSPGMTPATILNILVKGKEYLFRITIPEGFDMFQIADIIASKGFCKKEKFLTLCRDKKFISSLNVPSHTLEGFLFPDTYFFPKHSDCRQIIQKMVNTFFSQFNAEWRKQAKEMNLSIKSVVIIASLIEKETRVAQERFLISSVFHNRLQRGMRIESDPTVIYGDTDFSGRIRKKHLHRDTPYNTYLVKGLPKGPISNPGRNSIEAALYPVKSDYLYFVSKDGQTHYFSKTFSEHNRAVRKYILKSK